MAMMAMTTSSSIRVNALFIFFVATLNTINACATTSHLSASLEFLSF